MNRLDLLGYIPFFSEEFSKLNRFDFIPGKVGIENKNNYIVFTEDEEIFCEVSGSLLYTANNPSELPKVGDWVALAKFDDLGIIHHVLKRKTKLSRKSLDKKTSEQILVTNVDVVLLMQSANDNFNLNRLERQATAVYNSGAEPIFLLSKTDLCENPDEILESVKTRLKNLKVLSISSLDNSGIEKLETVLHPGKIFTLIGSSGVGKSTLVNKLLGEEKLVTQQIREVDSRGKHTTTRRELLILPKGGVIIDTPGLREFGLWEDSTGLSTTYSGFEEYAVNCKYDDCSHTVEKGCAVKEAVEAGLIPSGQYENYLKLKKELDYLERKIDITKALEEKRKWKNIHKEAKRIKLRGKNKF